MDWLPSLNLPLLSLPQILQRLVAALVVVGVHGWAVAWLAGRLGDPGPTYDGRRVPNPLVHLDLLGLVHALFFRLAWMPRVDADLGKLRGGWLGGLAVVVGSSAVLAVFSALLLFLRAQVPVLLRDSAALTVGGLMNAAVDVAIATAVIHLLPLPPFVGALWAPWAARTSAFWNGPTMRWIGVALVVLASLTGVTGRLLASLLPAWRGLLGF